MTSDGVIQTSLQGFTDDLGYAELRWKIPRGQAPGQYSATVGEIIKSGDIHGAGGVSSVIFFIQ